jgi:uncharacterized protein YjbJ (UPF0337 family)
MQTDVLLARWKHLKAEINDYWAGLGQDDLDQVHGRRDKLIALLITRYGFVRRRAEREVERVVAEFESKLRRAA